MADEKVKESSPAYKSLDRKGCWFLSKAIFPLEDPTFVHKEGKGAMLPRFEPGAFTQATETDWTEAQWKAGIFVKYKGHPEDEGSEPLVYVDTPAKAPALSPADTKAADQKATDAKASDNKTDAKK